jgi:Tfp pilus assembly protein PilF
LIKSPPVAKSAEPRSVKTVPTIRDPRVNEQLRNARTYLDQGQYTEALIELDKASQIDPGNRTVQTAIANAKRACNAEKQLGRSNLKC